MADTASATSLASQPDIKKSRALAAGRDAVICAAKRDQANADDTQWQIFQTAMSIDSANLPLS